jgi:hypothetical protein
MAAVRRRATASSSESESAEPRLGSHGFAAAAAAGAGLMARGRRTVPLVPGPGRRLGRRDEVDSQMAHDPGSSQGLAGGPGSTVTDDTVLAGGLHTVSA